jgi:hypothetical protein
LVAAVLMAAGGWLWSLHARAWDLGRRSPVLGYDAAQYALAARELAEHGRLATTYALPIELVRHPAPPWPLAAVQPGLVVSEALVERVTPRHIGRSSLASPAEREWLSLALPLASYLALALLLCFGVARLLGGSPAALAGGAVVALAFLLDPEAQHFATGGFTELPFTLGVTLALFALASGAATRRPLLFGLLLGVAGSFRANMLWLAPAFAVAVALLAAPPNRWKVAALVLLGWALPLAPWWVYKWRAFGSPGFDLSRLMVWEGVEGRSWFSLLHLPEAPAVPRGPHALVLLADKAEGNVGALLLALATGPRALWVGAIVVWLATRPPRPLALAALVVLYQAIVGVLATAASIPWLRYLFPARIPLEAAGLLATWGLVERLPAASVGPATRRIVSGCVAALAIGWGAWECGLGLSEARGASTDRGIPSVRTLGDLSALLDRELATGEPVMSNLGPTLAYHARRPVIHLALSPDDVEACRARVTFTHVLLVFRDVSRAWVEWRPVMEPGGERGHSRWNVTRARRWQTADGFSVVWLELGAPRPELAAAPYLSTATRRDRTWPLTVTSIR